MNMKVALSIILFAFMADVHVTTANPTSLVEGRRKHDIGQMYANYHSTYEHSSREEMHLNHRAKRFLKDIKDKFDEAERQLKNAFEDAKEKLEILPTHLKDKITSDKGVQIIKCFKEVLQRLGIYGELTEVAIDLALLAINDPQINIFLENHDLNEVCLDLIRIIGPQLMELIPVLGDGRVFSNVQKCFPG